MENLDYWRLCDELTVTQAALLIIGEDPSDGSDGYILNWQPDDRPKGFNAVFSALKVAITSNAIKSKVVHSGEIVHFIRDGIERSDWVRDNIPDWNETTVPVDDLKRWLSWRGMRPAFFFPTKKEDRDYLDSGNQFYAPKMAAAVKAWESVVNNPDYLRNKTPKQALEKWLREHAAEYGLLKKDDGTHNIQGIEQIAKVANWKPEGGATKTPSVVTNSLTTPLQPPANESISEEQNSYGDDELEIPF